MGLKNSFNFTIQKCYVRQRILRNKKHCSSCTESVHFSVLEYNRTWFTCTGMGETSFYSLRSYLAINQIWALRRCLLLSCQQYSEASNSVGSGVTLLHESGYQHIPASFLGHYRTIILGAQWQYSWISLAEPSNYSKSVNTCTDPKYFLLESK